MPWVISTDILGCTRRALCAGLQDPCEGQETELSSQGSCLSENLLEVLERLILALLPSSALPRCPACLPISSHLQSRPWVGAWARNLGHPPPMGLLCSEVIGRDL